MTKDIKKSNFIEQSTVADSDTFDFVTNDTNRKITKANLVSLFGTTGSLAQRGSITQTPVLKQVGTINYIRNMEDGYGVKASVSPNDGVLLDHNFTPGSTGNALLVDEATTQPMILNLIPGAGITMARVGDALQVTAAGTVVAANIVVVNAMSDFPTAVLGVITLAADTAYLISANLTTSSRFVFSSGSVVYGTDSDVSSLTYTGSDAMFTAVNNNFKITKLKLTCASGSLFAVSGTGIEDMQFINCTVDEVKNLGTIADYLAVVINDVAFLDIDTDGFDFSGSFGLIIFKQILVYCNGGTFCDLGTATVSLGFNMSFMYGSVAAGATALSGAADSANIGAEASGVVLANSVDGAGTLLNGITGSDALWTFVANAHTPDSRSGVLITLDSSQLITIAAQNTPVKLEGTWTEQDASRFEYTSPGRITYIGKGDHIALQASVTAELATATDDCTFYFFKNGVEITASGIQRSFTAGSPGNIGLTWSLDMETNDYIEIWAENNDTTVNITVSTCILRAS